MANTPSIVVVGSYIHDLAFRCEKFPDTGETRLGTFSSGPGGKGSNQAVAAARMGAKVAFVGALGDDDFGAGARAFHRTEGIDARWTTKKQPTGAASIVVDARGDNQIVVAAGANLALSGRDIPKGLIEKAEVVIAQLETSIATTTETLRRGWDAGTITVLNPAPMRPDFDPGVLRYVDVLIPNESEFAELLVRLGLVKQSLKIASLSDRKLGAFCKKLGVPTLVLTLGAQGVYLWQGDNGRRFPALSGLKVVDTTGAGDAFVGGFAAGLVHFEGDLAKAVRFGITVAGLSVTKPGTAPSMPTQREMTAWLKRNRA